MVVKVCGDLLADGNAAQLDIAAGHALCKGNDIRHYIEVLKGKHLSGSAEACHDFIADHHNAELVADLPDARQIALRRNDNAVRAGDGLHLNGSDAVCALIDDLFPQLCQIISGCLFFGRKIQRFPVNIRVKKLDKARNARLQRIASRLTSQISGAERRTVIAPVTAEHLVSAGVHSGDLDGVFIGICAGIGEEHLAERIRQQVDDRLAQLCTILIAEGRPDVAVLVHLCLDGVADRLVAVAQVHVDLLRGHIRIPLSIGIIEIDSL